MKRYRELTADEIKAIKSYAEYAGRTWKSKLALIWLQGDNGTTGHLQRIRNDFGPTWLVNLRLKDLR